MDTNLRTLEQVEPSLPSHYYFDTAHYEEELKRIWYRHWLCIGRSDAIANSGDYRIVTVGDQSVIVTRDEQQVLQAFHNTCRHRGSIICEQATGSFRNGRIVCPYHAWTYSLSGDLAATPRRLESPDFDFADFSLYRVAIGEWGGFVFVNLDADAPPFSPSMLGQTADRLGAWPLQDLAIAHTLVTDLECNWKVFWENFSECYHCPGVHPELCTLVPMYNDAIATNNLLDPTLIEKPPLTEGAVTWSMDGQTQAPWIEGLSEKQQQAGHTFGTFKPSGYIVTHVDYARIVTMLPLTPERTQLEISWLVPQSTLQNPDFDVQKIVEFGALVVEQDGKACELNQRGLRSNRHASGVLVAQEIAVFDFHQWVRSFFG